MARGKKTELTPAEKERLRRALSDFEGSTILDIENENPEYYYFLAAKEEKYPGHPQSVSALERLGYEIVNEDNNDGEVMPHGTVRSPDGGAVQTHELVLMRIPRWLHEERVNRQVEEALKRAEASPQKFEEALEKIHKEYGAEGVRVFRNIINRETY